MVRRHSTDVIVVGAGPAGSLLAILLGRAGFRVELFERSRFPREKPCGEGLLPPGREVLEKHGLADIVGGERLEGVRYHLDDDSVRAAFGRDAWGQPRYGLGQRRSELDERLFHQAACTAGVRVEEGVPICGPILEEGRVTGVRTDREVRRAALVVAADGASSTIRRGLGQERAVEPVRVGIRAHFRLARRAASQSDIEVFLRRGYELYVTPLPNDEVLVAALAHEDVAGKNLRLSFARWCRREPRLFDLLAGATPCSDPMGRAPLLKRTRTPLPPGVILLGDAWESVDPVTAGGISLALSSAHLLAPHVGAILTGDGRALAEFESARRQEICAHRWLGAALRTLSRRPWLAHGTKRLIDAHPSAMSALVGLAAGRAVA